VRPLTLFVPLIILTLKDADTIAMAIDARGFRRQ
jgi:biotin transport system permease protein